MLLRRRHKKKIDDKIKKNDYDSMSYTGLKSLASEKDINTYKMKKEDIIEALQEVGE